MKVIKLNYENVILLKGLNQNDELYRQVKVVVNKFHEVNVSDFIKTNAYKLLAIKYKDIDFNTLGEFDISNKITSVSLIRDDNKYGVKFMVRVVFDINYEFDIVIDKDLFSLLITLNKLEDEPVNDKSSKNIKKETNF